MSSECCAHDLSFASYLFSSFFSLNVGSTIRPSFVFVDGAYVFIYQLNWLSAPFIRVWSYDSWAKFGKSRISHIALQIFVRSFFLVQRTIWAISVMVVKMRWDEMFVHYWSTAFPVCRRLHDGISHIGHRASGMRTLSVMELKGSGNFLNDISFQTESIERLLQLGAGGCNLAQAILELGQWHSIDCFLLLLKQPIWRIHSINLH